MSEISVLDLQKMTEYASQCKDPEIKKLFTDAANSAMKNKQDLMKFL